MPSTQFWPGWPGQFPPAWGSLPPSARPPTETPLEAAFASKVAEEAGPFAAALAAATAAASAVAAGQSQVVNAKATGSSSAALASTAPGGTSSSVTGNATAVRLRGLPFSATEQDVLAFFAQHDIVDRVTDGPNAVTLLLRSNGRPSGQAVVQMRGRADAELAQKVLGGQWMGTRYIEVFLYTEDGTSESTGTGGGGAAAAAGTAPDSAVRGASVGSACNLAMHATLPTPPTVNPEVAAMAAAAAAAAAFGGFPTWPTAPWGAGAAAMAASGAGLGIAGGHPLAHTRPGETTWEALFEFLGPEASNMAALAASGGGAPGACGNQAAAGAPSAAAAV